MSRISILLCSSLGMFFLLQHRAPSQEPPVIRTITRLVTLSAVVTIKGSPVEGLTREDFRVLDNGVSAQIQYFSAESASAIASGPAHLPPGVVSNELSRRAAPPAITVILLDTINANVGDITSARQQVMRVLSQLRSDDHVGLYALGSGVRVLHEVMESPESLIRKVQSGSLHFESLPSTDGLPIRTFGALAAVARHLSAYPGRKNLIWISSSFSLIPDIGGSVRPQSDIEGYQPNVMEHEDVMQFAGPKAMSIKTDWPAAYSHAVFALSGGDVAVYPVDARGLSAEPQWDNTPSPMLNAPRPLGSTRSRTMLELAGRTGGKAYLDSNDIKGAVRQVIDSARVTYSLGFHPVSPRGDGSLHKIEVHVNRRGVAVYCRRGYFDTPDEGSRANSVNTALHSGSDAIGVGIMARAQRIEGVKPKLRVEVLVQSDTITAQQEGEMQVFNVDLILAPMDEGDSFYPGVKEGLTIRLSPRSYQEMLRSGLKLERTIELNERTTKLRVVVRDQLRDTCGSVTIPASQFLK